jgi:hypothetical protein
MRRRECGIEIAPEPMLPNRIIVSSGEKVNVAEIGVHDRREWIELESESRLGDGLFEPPFASKDDRVPMMRRGVVRP